MEIDEKRWFSVREQRHHLSLYTLFRSFRNTLLFSYYLSLEITIQLDNHDGDASQKFTSCVDQGTGMSSSTTSI